MAAMVLHSLRFMQGDEFPANSILGNSEGQKVTEALTGATYTPALTEELVGLQMTRDER